MTTPSQSNRNHQHEAALAYDLFGYLKITNIFTRSEISEISDAYDQYHLDINKIECQMGKKRIPPTGSLLENDPKLIDSNISKAELIHTLREVAGKAFNLQAQIRFMFTTIPWLPSRHPLSI